MIELSGGHERSDQSGASEPVSGASKRANEGMNKRVAQSGFLIILDHSAALTHSLAHSLASERMRKVFFVCMK